MPQARSSLCRAACVHRFEFFAGDDVFLGAAAKAYVAEGSDWKRSYYMPTRADSAIMGMRKWMDKYSAGRIPFPEHMQVLVCCWMHKHVLPCHPCLHHVAYIVTRVQESCEVLHPPTSTLCWYVVNQGVCFVPYCMTHNG